MDYNITAKITTISLSQKAGINFLDFYNILICIVFYFISISTLLTCKKELEVLYIRQLP